MNLIFAFLIFHILPSLLECTPIVDNPISDKVVKTDTYFSIDIPRTTFSSQDSPKTPLHMHLSSENVPSWMTLKPKAGLLSTQGIIPSGNCFSLAIVDDFVYCTSNMNGIQIFNVSDLTDPIYVGKVLPKEPLEYSQYDVDGCGDFLYVGIYYVVKILNISDRSTPVLIRNVTHTQKVNYIYCENNLLFIAWEYDGIKIYNVTTHSQGANPEVIGGIDTYNAQGMTTIFNYRGTGENILFLADSAAGFKTVNITDPTKPVQLGVKDTPSLGITYHVSVDEEKQYVFLVTTVSSKYRMATLNITDLFNPTILQTEFDIPCANELSFSATLVNDRAYVSAERCGLQVVDTRDPSNMAIYDEFSTPTNYEYTWIKRKDKKYLYIAGRSHGLLIYTIDDNYQIYGTPPPKSCGEIYNFTIASNDDTGVVHHNFLIQVEHKYFGVDCHICDGIDYNNKAVCSNSRGNCTARDVCKCFDSYEGKFCQISTCFGVRSNITNKVCHNHGVCESHEICRCQEYYFGSECNITTCDTIFNNISSQICSGHGICENHNNCTCVDPKRFFGWNCNWTTCFGVISTDERTCSMRGRCVDRDKCICEENYYGENCNITTCNGYFTNISNTLKINLHGDHDGCGNGTCISFNNCSCKNGYFGSSCEMYECHGILFNSSTVCSGHGECVFPNHCECTNVTNYYPSGKDQDCSTWKCFNHTRFEEKNVCFGHGTCVDHQNCSCDNDDWRGENCQFWSCFGVYTDEKHICASHGACLEVDKCDCVVGYFSSSSAFGVCDTWFCGEYRNSMTKVCGGVNRGRCVSSHVCGCTEGYSGTYCETFKCGGIDFSSELVCNERGECVGPDDCECKSGYSGSFCETNDYLVTVMTPILTITGVSVGVATISILFLLLILVCCVFCCFCVVVIVCCVLVVLLVLFLGLCGTFLCCCASLVSIQKRRMKKFSRLKNVDLLLREQEMEEDSSVAHLKINKKLFEIPFDEIKTISILGEGGSQSLVFKAKWRGQIVAFKCFKTKNIAEDQGSFDDFEKEVQILSSLGHPNIVQFYGATMKPPRVGIVMEFCENGELLDFYSEYEAKHNEEFPINRKIEMVSQIVSAMTFCHSRNIIHRDLKCENVLVDNSEKVKLMDFGLSKAVDNIGDSQAMTKTVGTSVYMAPEVVLSDVYDEYCDVFSFAIMFYVIILEDPKPYGKKGYRVEFKVASNPRYRPDLNRLDEKLKNKTSKQWIKYIIKRCWDHTPKYRLSFVQIGELFERHLSEVDVSKEADDEEEVFSSTEEGKVEVEDPAKLLEEIDSLMTARKRIQDLEKELESVRMELMAEKQTNVRHQRQSMKK